ncbi:MAG: hypothetical protein JO000_14665 [Alphaproteobacteria bacterium]|nr:hypothetical protein [Alphaproteobacteria bacterium]
MYDRRMLLWPREDWPVIRQVALTIAACQLAAFLTVGALIWHVDGKAPGSVVAGQAQSIR